MKKPPATLHFVLLLAAAALTLAGAATSSAEPAQEIFTGQYDWRDGGKDDLQAEFYPDGEGEWRVKFRFDFDGKKHTWKGTAEGNLDEGSTVTGTTSWRSRDWRFEAAIENGVMRGTHTELRSRGRTYETGTFELRR